MMIFDAIITSEISDVTRSFIRSFTRNILINYIIENNLEISNKHTVSLFRDLEKDNKNLEKLKNKEFIITELFECYQNNFRFKKFGKIIEKLYEKNK